MSLLPTTSPNLQKHFCFIPITFEGSYLPQVQSRQQTNEWYLLVIDEQCFTGVGSKIWCPYKFPDCSKDCGFLLSTLVGSAISIVWFLLYSKSIVTADITNKPAKTAPSSISYSTACSECWLERLSILSYYFFPNDYVTYGHVKEYSGLYSNLLCFNWDIWVGMHIYHSVIHPGQMLKRI